MPIWYYHFNILVKIIVNYDGMKLDRSGSCEHYSFQYLAPAIIPADAVGAKAGLRAQVSDES